MICRPTGGPADVRPTGAVVAGNPVNVAKEIQRPQQIQVGPVLDVGRDAGRPAVVERRARPSQRADRPFEGRL